jgi:hypothetical protein
MNALRCCPFLTHDNKNLFYHFTFLPFTFACFTFAILPSWNHPGRYGHAMAWPYGGTITIL